MDTGGPGSPEVVVILYRPHIHCIWCLATNVVCQTCYKACLLLLVLKSILEYKQRI